MPRNLAPLLAEWQDHGLRVSEGTRKLFLRLQGLARDAVRVAARAVRDRDEAAVHEVESIKRQLDATMEETARRIARRLAADAPDRLDVYRVESDLVEVLKRIVYFARRAARTVRAAQDTAAAP